MLKIIIGILLTCMLALSANALSEMKLPVIPWFAGHFLPAGWVMPAKWRALLRRYTARFIRGPNAAHIPIRPRPGTSRRWIEAASLVLP